MERPKWAKPVNLRSYWTFLGFDMVITSFNAFVSTVLADVGETAASLSFAVMAAYAMRGAWLSVQVLKNGLQLNASIERLWALAQADLKAGRLDEESLQRLEDMRDERTTEGRSG